MNISIYAKNIELTGAIRSYVEDKISSLTKFIRPSSIGVSEAKVEIGKPSERHKTGPVFYAEVNLKVGGEILRATAKQADLYAAVDEIREELENQIKKNKEKRIDARRKSTK